MFRSWQKCLPCHLSRSALRNTWIWRPEYTRMVVFLKRFYWGYSRMDSHAAMITPGSSIRISRIPLKFKGATASKSLWSLKSSFLAIAAMANPKIDLVYSRLSFRCWQNKIAKSFHSVIRNEIWEWAFLQVSWPILQLAFFNRRLLECIWRWGKDWSATKPVWLANVMSETFIRIWIGSDITQLSLGLSRTVRFSSIVMTKLRDQFQCR